MPRSTVLAATLGIGTMALVAAVTSAGFRNPEAARREWSAPTGQTATTPMRTAVVSPTPPARAALVNEAGAHRGPTDPLELAAFLDGLMSAHMEDDKIVGATVAVVRDSRLLYAHGYGWADQARHVPVDPATTLFRIGSVTKLFTWTAVMQLVEQGKLDLHRDVNTYLDFTIPDTYPGHPITLWNLMTHTPGFEDRSFGLFSETMEPRGRFLAEHIPARVRPPGEYAAYSNYGAALAGYIVERVSGVAWERYVRAHILEPLGMRHTTVDQPLPLTLAADMSVGYLRGGDDPEVGPFETLLPMAPAGSGSASAEDMARFMIAQLADGECDGHRILGDAAARLMSTRQFSSDPRLPGFDLGFYEQDSHGVHVIGHGGDTDLFHSDLSLIPTERLGVFVAFNTASGVKVSFGPFLQEFLDHYFPQRLTPTGGDVAPRAVKGRLAIPIPVRDDQAYIGHYRMNRMSYTTAEKAAGLLSGVDVRRDANRRGGIVVTMGEVRRHFAPVRRNMFQQVDGSQRIVFQVERGRATHFFLSDLPMMAGERIAWYQTGGFSLGLLAIALPLFLTAVLAPPARWLVRKRFPQIAPLAGKTLAARRVQVTVALLALGSVVAIAVALSHGADVVKGHGAFVYLALTLTTLTAIATLALLWYTALVWRHRLFDGWARLHYILVALGALAFMWVLAQWNLLGWRL
jgi:CubicO group peptidase (beta-lactamase class C family)